MENHRGPIYYYLVALLLGFVPWSSFLIPALFYRLWNQQDETRRQRESEIAAEPQMNFEAGRFLACWIVVYLVFFSISGTKLPNYILPIYPAVAILTARFLDDWRRGLLSIPPWVMPTGLAGIALVGIAAGLGLLLASGLYDVRFFRDRQMPGLEVWALIGVIPIAGALLSGWLLRTGQKIRMVASLTGTALLFVGTLAAWGTLRVDAFKAPRPLVQEAGACQTDRDIRIGCYQFYQPSLVFYCHREVRVLNDEEQVLEFLRTPLPIYLFVSAQAWENLKDKVRGPHRLLARHQDVYKGFEVVVITNDGAISAAQVQAFSR
jgi:hypothetical protein